MQKKYLLITFAMILCSFVLLAVAIQMVMRADFLILANFLAILGVILFAIGVLIISWYKKPVTQSKIIVPYF